MLIGDIEQLLYFQILPPLPGNFQHFYRVNVIQTTSYYKNIVINKLNFLLGFNMNNNKAAHLTYGNIISVENLSIIQYNKGSSYMENVLVPLEDFMQTHRPSITMLSEANFDFNERLDINERYYPWLSQYAMEGSKFVGNLKRSRVMSLIRKDLQYKRCHDLEPDGLSSVFLELSISKHKKIYFIG